LSKAYSQLLWTEASSHVRGSAADLKNLVENGNPGLVAAPVSVTLSIERRCSMKIRKTLALAAAGGMLLLPPLAYEPAGEQAPTETKVSVDHSPLRLHTLPFSVGQVLDYFK
jgi:hypothetical protein